MNFVKEANETLSYIYAASIFVLSTSILYCILYEDFRFIKPLYVLEMLLKLKILTLKTASEARDCKDDS